MPCAPSIDDLFNAWCNHQADLSAIAKALAIDSSQLLALWEDPEFIRRRALWKAALLDQTEFLARDHRIATASKMRELLNGPDPVEVRRVATTLSRLADALSKGSSPSPRPTDRPSPDRAPNPNPPSPPAATPSSTPPQSAPPSSKPPSITDVLQSLRGPSVSEPPDNSPPPPPSPPPLPPPVAPSAPQLPPQSPPVEPDAPAPPPPVPAPAPTPAADPLQETPTITPTRKPQDLPPPHPISKRESPASARPKPSSPTSIAAPRTRAAYNPRDGPPTVVHQLLNKHLADLRANPQLARRFPPGALDPIPYP